MCVGASERVVLLGGKGGKQEATGQPSARQSGRPVPIKGESWADTNGRAAKAKAKRRRCLRGGPRRQQGPSERRERGAASARGTRARRESSAGGGALV